MVKKVWFVKKHPFAKAKKFKSEKSAEKEVKKHILGMWKHSYV